jgi:hypothetical protein
MVEIWSWCALVRDLIFGCMGNKAITDSTLKGLCFSVMRFLEIGV